MFDGASFAVDAKGVVCARAPIFTEATPIVEVQGGAVRGDLQPMAVKAGLNGVMMGNFAHLGPFSDLVDRLLGGEPATPRQAGRCRAAP